MSFFSGFITGMLFTVFVAILLAAFALKDSDDDGDDPRAGGTD